MLPEAIALRTACAKIESSPRMKKALISGTAHQDGFCCFELPLVKTHEVHGFGCRVAIEAPNNHLPPSGLIRSQTKLCTRSLESYPGCRHVVLHVTLDEASYQAPVRISPSRPRMMALLPTALGLEVVE